MSSKPVRREPVNVCVVCCEDIEFFAVGVCDHPVCHKCCVRMRVLGKEIYCPVCRTELQQVFITKDSISYRKLAARRGSSVIDKRHSIHYQQKGIQDKVKELLEHRCQFCPSRQPERSFDRLRDHMKREHEKFYCDLCVANLQKFSFELKAYTRSELARHRRVGDSDDKSHKGHPLCKFCDQRYLDNDELHKHLRKDHFWCHFCERDGSQDYYPNYEHLRKHFRDFHFLCEEDDCIHEQFTSVFRTKVDFQAHRAAKHSGKLSKAQARQARQLDVDITFAPRPRPQTNHGSIAGRDFVEVRSSEQRKEKREKGGKRGNFSGPNRKEALELQTAMALSLSESASDPSQLPSPSSKPQEPKKHKPEEKGAVGGLPDNETEAVAQFPASLGSLEVTNVDEGFKKGSKPSKPTTYASASTQPYSVDDFPSLSTSGERFEPSPTVPPGFASAARQPPPLAVTQQTSRAKPPPGFQTLFEPTSKEKVKENVAPLQEPTITKTEVKANSSVQERNQALVDKIRGLLGYKSKFEEFKELSGKFRKSFCSAEEYYAQCCELFESNFSQVFTELVDLLPDPDKRKELLAAHQDAKIMERHQGHKNKAGTVNKKPPMSGVWQTGATAWNVETNIGGISERDFPALPAASKPSYQQRYKAPKNATMLKEAWIRGK